MNELSSASKNIELGDIFQSALASMKKKATLLFSSIMFMSLIPTLLIIAPMVFLLFQAGLFATASGEMPKTEVMLASMNIIGLGSVLFFLVYTALKLGWTSICLKVVSGTEVSYSEFKLALNKYWQFLGVHVLLLLVVSLGFIFFIIPGIFLAVRLAFAQFLVIEKDLSPMEALKASWNLATGFSWQILLLGVCYMVASMIGGFIPLVGIAIQLVAVVYYDLLLVVAYKKCAGTFPSPAISS